MTTTTHRNAHGTTRRRILVAAAALAAAATMAGTPEAEALDKVTFGTNWKAQAEHGGFYQALATGIYEKHGLDVTIRMGGPQVNHSQLLAAGVVDFVLGESNIGAFNYVKNDVPLVAVAAFFQKDVRVIIAHPGQGNDSLEAMKGKPILVADSGRVTYWRYMKGRYGFTDDQLRPYTFSLAPFLADKSTIQQGYLTAEPYSLEQQGIQPVVHLLSEDGYNSYSSVMETSWKLVNENPDLVQRFVDASIEGWYSYLYGDPTPGNDLIKKDNPDMTDGQIAYSIGKLKEYGILDSGDALTMGIGAMTDERWKDFYALMVKSNVVDSGLDISKAYTTQFVNKGVGMDMKKN